MRRLRRFLLAVASTALTFGIIAATVCVLALVTDAGQDLIRRQTEAVIARVLGADFQAILGAQTIDLTEDGNIAIRWSDVVLIRRDSDVPASTAKSIKVGVAVLPLMRGRLMFDRIEIDGADIDLTGDRFHVRPVEDGRVRAEPETAASPPVATAADTSRPLSERFAAGLASLERQFAALDRLGIDRVVLRNVTMTAPIAAGGGPFHAKIDRAALLIPDGEALSLSARLRIDGNVVSVKASVVFDHAAGVVDAATASIGPIALGEFIPPGSPDDRLDRRPLATDARATVSLALQRQAEDDRRRLAIGIDVGEGALQAGRGHTRIDRVHAELGYLEGEEAVELAADISSPEGFATGLDGRVVAAYDATDGKSLNGFDFSLQSREMRSSIGRQKGAKPVEASLVIEGRLDLTSRELRSSKLVLATGGGTLGGDARLRFGALDEHSTLALDAEGLDAGSVKAFWPFNIAVNARRWVLEHVGDSGGVTGGRIAIDVRKDRLGVAFEPDQTPRPEELNVQLDLDGADVSTVGALPRLLGAKGRVVTRGGDTLVSLDAAGVEGFAAVTVEPSSVSFVRVPPTSLQDMNGTLSLHLAGEMRELLAIAEREPINALRSLPVKPADATGRAKVAATLGFILGDDVPRDRQFGAWKVVADLDGAGLSVPVEGRRLDVLTGPVTIEPGAASGKIEGTVDGIPATITFNRPFGQAPVGEKSLEVAASLTGARVAELAPALDDIVDGPIAATVRQGEEPQLTAEVDLSDAALNLPWVGWRKGKGVAAKLSFAIEPGESGTVLKDISLKGEGFSATGTVATDSGGIAKATLGNVALNPGDDVDVTVERVRNGYSIRVDGERFDARPFLNDLKENLGAKAENPGPRSKRQIDVGLSVDRVTGFGGEEISGFQLNYAGSGGRIAALSLAGTSRGGPFTADMSPRGEERSITVRTPDAGSLADFTGIYGRMEGGAVQLDLLGSATSGYRGVLKAENFTLVDEPRLSNLVGSSPAPNQASLSQAVGTELRTERAYFDHASAGIAYGKGGLRVSDGIIRGPVFGSSFDGIVYDARNRIDITGSFMPAYGVNRIFGAIPVVGQILGNGNEGGLIGITYRLDGAFSSPTLTVNPISAIAPGIFRNIFAYQ